jgi:hypothetical protein
MTSRAEETQPYDSTALTRDRNRVYKENYMGCPGRVYRSSEDANIDELPNRTDYIIPDPTKGPDTFHST